VPNEGSTVCEKWQPFFISPETAGWGRKCETERCHGEATRSVLAKVRGDVFTRFHADAAKPRSRARNSQLGLLGRYFALPQLLYRWRHPSGIFWIPPRKPVNVDYTSKSHKKASTMEWAHTTICSSVCFTTPTKWASSIKFGSGAPAIQTAMIMYSV
jgi:hypothetical protein